MSADREAAAVERATALVCAVRAADAEKVAAAVVGWPTEAGDVAIALADRVRTLQALPRVVIRPDPGSAPGRNLRAAHAAYEAARQDGRLSTELVVGERDYQRERDRASITRSRQRQRGGETGRCPVCGGVFRVRRDGEPFRHKLGTAVCPGSGSPVDTPQEARQGTSATAWGTSGLGVAPEPSEAERRTA